VVAAPPRQPDQLDVVSEAVHLDGGEQLARHRPVEQLEAALGVAQAAHADDSDQEVEGLPHELAVERLALLDVSAGDGAAAEHQVGLAEPRLEPRQVLDRGREVGVREQHPRAAGGQDAGAQRRALAAVAGVAKQRHALGGEPLRHGGSVVAAAVVDHQQLVRVAAAGQIIEHPPQGETQPLRLVVGGDHDGDRWRHLEGF